MFFFRKPEICKITETYFSRLKTNKLFVYSNQVTFQLTTDRLTSYFKARILIFGVLPEINYRFAVGVSKQAFFADVQFKGSCDKMT